MRRATPPFRADHVGSLLRPERLLRARELHVPLGQLCLSPQCGFSSTVEGNALTYDEEVAKLRLIVDVARDVWGD
jgi:5-methyltetrahydropteroyltriglutamate--homocysteine methyltransferase